MINYRITKSASIKKFLETKTHDNLSELYNLSMEVQVNVAQDNGDRTGGEFKGKKWHGWTDGVQTWKPFRIPYNAKSNPVYSDTNITFDLAAHAEGIGMTGWDWENKLSRWVAFDFDAIIGHSDKHGKRLSDNIIQEIRQAAENIPWVTIRKSTSGRGLHLYIFIEPTATQNHNEHAALARAILGKLSALAGYDFQTKVDACGGNMWIWHRKMQGTDGLILLKQGTTLIDIPPNWRDHMRVIKGIHHKNKPQIIPDEYQDFFDSLIGQRPNNPLDKGHKSLITYLQEHCPNAWWWDSDHHMLVTHTHHLKDAHESLNFRGYFDTASQGTEPDNDHNCFLFPLLGGGWAVRRFTPGVQEHDSWEQDASGWTRCYLNQIPDLAAACRAFGGLEDPKGGFIFSEAEIAQKAAQCMGISLKIDPSLLSRQCKLLQHKSGRLHVQIEHKNTDATQQGWLLKKDHYNKLYPMRDAVKTENEHTNYDDLIRHLIAEDKDSGWCIQTDSTWCSEPLAHVKSALTPLGYGSKDINIIVGAAILKPWKLVNKPFQLEYPGNREWNRNSAQYAYAPSQTDNPKAPTWWKVLNHCGKNLDQAVKENAWCKVNNIQTGGEYLMCWIASTFQFPYEPLPYLFFFSPEQNTGKSIFHEALRLLLTTGYRRADNALINPSGFNGELEGAIICVVEEVDLTHNRTAYNRIKDWVTSYDIAIHRKMITPYQTINTTHWIQCSNDQKAVPIFPGDTRIVICRVKPLNPLDLIPKKHLLIALEKEAPDFIALIQNLELPESGDRLNIPTITTNEKIQLEAFNQSLLGTFLTECTDEAPGQLIKFSDFVDRFHTWIDPSEIPEWSNRRISKDIAIDYPKGRLRKDNQVQIGNICWRNEKVDTKQLSILKDGYIYNVEADPR